MIRALFAILLMLGTPVAAEIARVQGGEHPDFTRIVVEAAAAGNWRFGRSADGYELALDDAVSGYDLSTAFDRIPKDRVSGLWRDPQTGRLRMALSCACHAIAFEFRPGIIVVDIKTGPPPEGSSFELPLDPPRDAPDASTPDPEASGGPSGYDWIALWRDAEADSALAGPGATAEGVEPTPKASPMATDRFRDALLAQISRGAAEGVVEIAERPELPAAADTPVSEGEGVRAGMGELPGLVITGPGQPADRVAANGEQCLPDDLFAVGDWRPDGPVAEVIGLSRAGLLEEFDVPVTAAILRAARTHVAYGFGAEARQILGLLPETQGPEEQDAARILRTMSFAVDLEPNSEDVLAGMESCDGAVALWAVLADLASGREVRLADVNIDAIRRAFSGLPSDLRHHFSSLLVDFALRAGDQELARALRDAATRAPAEGDADVGLMEARVELAGGKAEAAREIAEDIMAEGGPMTAEAAVLLVEAALDGGQSVPEGTPEVLEAFLRDSEGQPIQAQLRRAVVLANALSGDFSAAFADLEASPATAPDLWALAATGADDEAFIAGAITAAATEDSRKGIARDTAANVAERLLALGFAKEALVWVEPVSATSDAAQRVLVGRAHLAMRDARAALAAVSGLDDQAAEIVRAEAVLQLGDPRNAAMFYDLGGDKAAGQRALVWTRDWDAIAVSGPEMWKSVAELAVARPTLSAAASEASAGQGDGSPSDPAGAATGEASGTPRGPLARGQDLADESERVRGAVEALLESVVSSEGP